MCEVWGEGGGVQGGVSLGEGGEERVREGGWWGGGEGGGREEGLKLGRSVGGGLAWVFERRWGGRGGCGNGKGKGGNTFYQVVPRVASALRGLEVGVEMLGVLAGESRALKGLVEGEVVVGLRFEIGARRTGRVWVVVAGVCSCWG